MARQKVHEVKEKKKDEMKIFIGKDFLLKAERRARREAAIEAGTYKSSGCGVHGGSKRDGNRRKRQANRLAIRRSNYDY